MADENEQKPESQNQGPDEAQPEQGDGAQPSLDDLAAEVSAGDEAPQGTPSSEAAASEDVVSDEAMDDGQRAALEAAKAAISGLGTPEPAAQPAAEAEPPATEPAEPAGDDPFAAARAAMAAASGGQAPAAAASSDQPPAESVPEPTQSFDLPAFNAGPPSEQSEKIDLLGNVNLNVEIELGRTRMLVEDVLKMKDGVVVELDKLAGDPVDVYVNDRLVARGEVLVLNDNFCVRISEIIDPSLAEAQKQSA